MSSGQTVLAWPVQQALQVRLEQPEPRRQQGLQAVPVAQERPALPGLVSRVRWVRSGQRGRVLQRLRALRCFP